MSLVKDVEGQLEMQYKHYDWVVQDIGYLHEVAMLYYSVGFS